MDLRHISLLGLDVDNAGLNGKSILELNNAPNALSLKFGNGKRKLISSAQHPDWMVQMFSDNGIGVDFCEMESMAEQGWDEVWVINVLQQNIDIERCLYNVKRSAKTLRVYQFLDESLTRDFLDNQLGIFGAVTTLTNGIEQKEIYYGCYDMEAGEKIPLVPNIRFWGGNTERAMIHYLKAQQFSQPLVMAEVGVLHGINAKFILETLNIRHLYLIDPYEEYKTDIYSQPDLDQAKANAKALLMPYKDRITWLYVHSLDAISILRNMQVELDAAYYDGDHSYAGTYENVEAYNKITRLCIGGHDYIPDSDNPGCEYGVMSAIQDWTKKHQYNFFCSEFPYSDWWVDKNGMG